MFFSVFYGMTCFILKQHLNKKHKGIIYSCSHFSEEAKQEANSGLKMLITQETVGI